MDNIYSFKEQIIHDEEGKRTLISLLQIIFFATVFIVLLMLVLRYFDSDDGFSYTDLALLLLMLSTLFSYFLLRKGRITFSSRVFLITAWCAMTFFAGRSAGIRDISIIGYLIIIYLATLLIGYRYAIFFRY